MAQIANNTDPSQFYKYEYKSKVSGEWKPLLKTDSIETLKKYKYQIRLKEIYRYEK